MPIALLSMASDDASSALLPATNTVIESGSLLVLRDTTNLEADNRSCAAMCIVEAALSNASSQQCSSSHGTGALTLSSLDGGGAGHGKAGNVSVCFEAGDTCLVHWTTMWSSAATRQGAMMLARNRGLALSAKTPSQRRPALARAAQDAMLGTERIQGHPTSGLRCSDGRQPGSQ